MNDTQSAGTPAPEGDDTVGITLWQAVGGDPFFHRLAARFYEGVANDETLLRLYPDQQDLGPAAERLALFLIQFWGGAHTYSEQRGHPRLRMRHMPFVIGETERIAWLAAMDSALEATLPETPLDAGLREEVAARLRHYFEAAAAAMVNQPDNGLGLIAPD